MIIFHAFSSTRDFTSSILADTDCNQDGNILNLTTPAVFQVDAIYINIGIFPGKRTGTPCSNLLQSHQNLCYSLETGLNARIVLYILSKFSSF